MRTLALLSSTTLSPELLSRLNVRIMFMSMFNDISWGSEDTDKACEWNAQLVSLHAKRVSTGQWSFFGPGSKKKWFHRVSEQMMIKFGQSGHSIFPSTSPLSRGVFESKGGGKFSIHFCVGGRFRNTRIKLIVTELTIDGSWVSTRWD